MKTKVLLKDMNVKKIVPSGALRVSIVLDNRLFSQDYFYYNVKDAKHLFKEYLTKHLNK